MNKLNAWHKTKRGLAVFALLELFIAFLLGSWAIDNGNILVYILTFLFTVGGLRNIYALVMKMMLKQETR